MNHGSASKDTGNGADADPIRRRQFLRFYEGHFVLDSRSGLFYRLTPSALFLLKAWSQGADTTDFARLLCEQFGVDPATARRDVELMLNQFRGLGLIDAQRAEGRP